MANLFHVAPILLGPGSVILPGNYGRLLRHHGERHHAWARESALEAARITRYPAKPSRLESCFACSDIAAARFYRWAPATGAGGGALYEVEKVDPDAPEHRADFNVIQPLPGRPETMEQIADLYWTAGLWVPIAQAPGVRCEEVVTPSALRVVKLID